MTIEAEDPPIATPAMGAGHAPAGSSPAGHGTPATAAAGPDPSAGSRYVNPTTRDYQLNPVTGQMAQMPPTRQKVLLALMTARGSSTAKPRFGLAPPRKMGSRFVNEMRQSVRAALSHLTQESNPMIRLQRIDVKVPRGGRAIVTVVYVDLSTGRIDEGSAPV